MNFRRHWISAVLFLIPLVLSVLGALVHFPEPYQHILLTLTAVMGIHVLDRLYLIKDTKGALDGLVLGIRDDIGVQTKSLISTSKSLEAMDRGGIVQIYPSRVEAAADISSDLSDSGNSKVRLIGISLNDFVQGMDRTLMDAWGTIQAFVRGKRPIDDRRRGLDIRVLIIDPKCFGATLRSEAESELSLALARRLTSDVNAAANDLLRLMEEAKPLETGVSFECRLYSLPPVLFLCWVDAVCYVQQYHFWSSRDNRTPTPVLKYRSLAASSEGYPYHQEMEHHFDWIWKNATVSVADYVEGDHVGTDQAVNQCGVVNIYMDPAKASNRIIGLLKGAQRKVSIQGVSLHSFFKPGMLREALSGVLERGEADVEVLLLDPESEQAKYRSYRERLFVSEDQSYSEYLTQGQHERSQLYYDTNRTLDNVRQVIEDIRRRKGPIWTPRLTVGLYGSAPACFVLRIDGRVFVEQYHYGKIASGARAVLGKDMPLFEYNDTGHPLYGDQTDPLRQPFALLGDHFSYALAQARKLDMQAPTSIVMV